MMAERVLVNHKNRSLRCKQQAVLHLTLEMALPSVIQVPLHPTVYISEQLTDL